MIAVEARKQVLRLRTYIGLGLVALIPIIFTASFKANPPKGHALGLFDLTASGINIPIASLAAESAFLLIVVVSLFAGETVSGEANWELSATSWSGRSPATGSWGPNWWSPPGWPCWPPFWFP